MEEKTKAVAYTKGQLLKAKKFSNYVDHLNALLKDGQMYSIDEVDKMIKDFLKREVK